MVGCRQIIAIDRVAARLDIAKAVGATDVVTTSEHVVEDIKKLTGGNGTSISLECVGRLSVIEEALAATARRGTLVLIGASLPTDIIQLPAAAFMMSGKRLLGCCEGDCTPTTVWPSIQNSGVLLRCQSSSHCLLNGIKRGCSPLIHLLNSTM